MKCSVNTQIPEVIKLYRNGEMEKAGELLFNKQQAHF